MVEKEGKYPVSSLEEIERLLWQSRASLIFEGTIFDTFLESPSKTLLRVREEMSFSGEMAAFLTWKGPNIVGNDLKSREEIEPAFFSLKDAKKMKMVLSKIGHPPKESLFDRFLEKQRRTFFFNVCLVMLDVLVTGQMYVEIEGDTENKIQETKKILGITSAHDERSYREIVKDFLLGAGLPPAAVLSSWWKEHQAS